jgi:hypothetical protein
MPPSSSSLIGGTKIPDQNISFGGYIFRDQSKTLSINGAEVNVSYTLNGIINNESQLTLGLGIKLLQFGITSDNLIARDQTAFESYLILTLKLWLILATI